MRRIDWQDSLLDAHTRGDITDSAAVIGIKMARLISWTSDAGPGLYWSNDSVAEAVGVSRATFYRARKVLADAGMVSARSGNVIPTVPEAVADQGSSLNSETQSLNSETDSRKSETICVRSETHNDAVDAVDVHRDFRLTGTTTFDQIEAAYPQHKTNPAQFTRSLAATLTVVIYRNWPESPPVDTEVLVRLFRKALSRYSMEVVGNAVTLWLAEQADADLRNPVGLFYSQSSSLFERANQPMEAAQ